MASKLSTSVNALVYVPSAVNTTLYQNGLTSEVVLTYLRGQLLDLVLPDAEHRELGEVPDVLLHCRDAVEAQVQRRERRQPVDHSRYLPKLVVPQVEHPKLLKRVQGVGQTGQGVLAEG